MIERNRIKQLGIWLDHSIAHMIDNSDSDSHHQHIVADNDKDHETHSVNKGESHQHHREHLILEAFYNQIAEKISHYNHVLLFGPTDAKSELYNKLKKDPHFNAIHIVLESSDKMTENEKNAYVKNYFNKALFPTI
jgi:stalled ribosome rescue protein Dom34